MCERARACQCACERERVKVCLRESEGVQVCVCVIPERGRWRGVWGWRKRQTRPRQREVHWPGGSDAAPSHWADEPTHIAHFTTLHSIPILGWASSCSGKNWKLAYILSLSYCVFLLLAFIYCHILTSSIQYVL